MQKKVQKCLEETSSAELSIQETSVLTYLKQRGANGWTLLHSNLGENKSDGVQDCSSIK